MPISQQQTTNADTRDIEINRLYRAIHHMTMAAQAAHNATVSLRQMLAMARATADQAKAESAALKQHAVDATKLQADTWEAAIFAAAAMVKQTSPELTANIRLLAFEGPEMIADMVQVYVATEGIAK